MDIEWIDKRYREAYRIFDSNWEAEEWADSLYSDFAVGLRVNVGVGYVTPDLKVFTYLMEHLPKWANYNDAHVSIHTAQDSIDGRLHYKIWVTPSSE